MTQAVPDKKLSKQARKAAKAGNHVEAARLFEQAGEVNEAVASYVAAGAPERGAHLLARSQRFEEAGKIYEGQRRYLVAAELYEQGKLYKQASLAYGRASKPYRQARALGLGGEWAAASAAFQKMSLTRRAADAAERAKDYSRAAELYLRAYEEEVANYAGDAAAARSYAVVGLIKKSGTFYAKAGQVDQAVAALQKAELYGEIADVFRQAGDTARAADYLAKSGRLEEASRTLEDSGDKKGASRLRGEIALQKGQALEAVGHFERAGELARAADIYRGISDFTNAGRLFEAAGEYGKAGQIYVESKQYDKAAAAFEKAGKFREAAEQYAKAGNSPKQTEMLEKAGARYEAGLSYFERGLFDQAIRALQEIAQGDADFERGKKLLGDIFREKGMLSLAIKNYQLALGGAELGPKNAEVYYQVAICQEKDNQPEAALSIYEKILVADYHFRDVSQRIQQVRRQIASRPPTPSQAGGLLGGIAGGASTPGTGRYDETRYGEATPTVAAQARRYVVEQELGRGGMGIVYKAKDTMLERTVALKVLPPALRSHPQALQAFLREAKSAAALTHPNIVTVYDVGEEAGELYISMEYIEGRTIKELLVQEGKIPYKPCLVITGQICRALQYAHDRKIIHRDIKPSNIMWTEKKEVKLMDFGLAKVLKDVTNQTTRVAGTPYYMSPEQTKGEAVDHRSDLYALGVTIWEMITGELPFPEGDIAYHHVHTPPPSMLSKVPDLPKAFDDVVLTLMQKKKEDRFQNADEVFEALKRAVGMG